MWESSRINQLLVCGLVVTGIMLSLTLRQPKMPHKLSLCNRSQSMVITLRSEDPKMPQVQFLIHLNCFVVTQMPSPWITPMPIRRRIQCRSFWEETIQAWLLWTPNFTLLGSPRLTLRKWFLRFARFSVRSEWWTCLKIPQLENSRAKFTLSIQMRSKQRRVTPVWWDSKSEMDSSSSRNYRLLLRHQRTWTVKCSKPFWMISLPHALWSVTSYKKMRLSLVMTIKK